MTKENISKFIESLEQKGKLPANIQKTVFESIVIYNIFDRVRSSIVSYGVATGIDDSELVALSKGLTEYVERMAFAEHCKRLESKGNGEEFHSDGFAAYPRYGSEGSGHNPDYMARKNAHTEAFERFVWANWWDGMTRAEISKLEIEAFHSIRLNSLCKLIRQHTPYRQLFLIIPAVANNVGLSTTIVFAELEGGGFLSGGAAGSRSDIETTVFRSLSEMARHSIGFWRYRTKGYEPINQYERRLVFFGSGKGDKLVHARLEQRGTKIIELPRLIADSQIAHQFNEQVAVHYCQFEGQPAFLGGDMGRLCL